MRWQSIGPGLAVASAVLLLVAPLGSRTGLWSFVVGFALLALSALLGAAAIVTFLVGGFRTQQWGIPLVGIVVGLAVLAVPVGTILSARGAPPINDITTDTDAPPDFQAVLPLRGEDAGSPAYDGEDTAMQQRRAYPDVQPIALSLPPDQAFERVLAVALELGWEIVARDQAAGRLEAIDTTFWFGFKDDIVIRVQGASDGARVDVRSKSRVGVGDLGANARRIRAFVSALGVVDAS